MKPRLYERLLTALYALLCAALGGLLIWALLDADVREQVTAPLSCTGTDRIFWIAGLALFILWGLHVVFMSLKVHRPRHRGFVSVQNSENGDVMIAVRALHSLASKAVANIEGVTCKDVRVVEHPDSISLRLRATVKGDHNVPNITALMQQVIRTHIETYSGIAVREVKVIITDIVTAPEMFVTAPAAPQKVEPPVEEIYYEAEPAVREDEAVNQESLPESEASAAESEGKEAEEDGSPAAE